MLDLEPRVINSIQNSEQRQLYNHENIFLSPQGGGAGNNWASGYSQAENFQVQLKRARIFFSLTPRIQEDILDMVDREAEGSDSLEGFVLCHSVAGGTGSGMGTLLLLKIRDNYPDRITATFSVYPSPKVSDVVVEPYNATLSIHQLLENSDETFVIDNEALFSISHNVLKQKEPKYADLNWVISMVMSGITASLRFSGKLNGDLRKMGVNLVPFPRLHFMISSMAPISSPQKKETMRADLQTITEACFTPYNFFTKFSFKSDIVHRWKI